MSPIATWSFFIAAIKTNWVSSIEVRQQKNDDKRIRYGIAFQLTMKEEMTELLTTRGTPLQFANMNTLIKRLDLDVGPGRYPSIQLVTKRII